jgi:hypothetical protein
MKPHLKVPVVALDPSKSVPHLLLESFEPLQIDVTSADQCARDVVTEERLIRLRG